MNKELLMMINEARDENEACKRFVNDYENNPDREVKSGDKIRYFFNKRNLTLGEAEKIIGWTGGTISSSSHQRNNEVDEVLSYLMNVPVNELRLKSSSTKKLTMKDVAKKLRKLANEIENNC